MRTFVIRARKGTVIAEKILSQVGTREHIEIIAHTLANAFYVSNDMRKDVEVYVVLESTPDFPRTLKFSANEKLSFPGFDERAILGVVVESLERGLKLAKDESLTVKPGITISGFGFEVLMKQLQAERPIYLLDKKGSDIRLAPLLPNGVFVLSDHLSLPKNSIKGLAKRGLTKLSLGRKMLFASHCVVLIHNELDRLWPG